MSSDWKIWLDGQIKKMPLPEMLEKVLQQGELTLLDEIINKVQSRNEELRMSNIRNRENLNPDLQVQVLSEDSLVWLWSSEAIPEFPESWALSSYVQILEYEFR